MTDRSAGPASPATLSSVTELAEELTRLRGRAGLSIRDVARATGIPHATLGGYFSGRHLPPVSRPDDFARILTALDVPAAAHGEWWDAVLRLRRTPGPRPRVPAPYRGLDSYRVEDTGLYVGREREVAQLLDLVTEALAQDGSGSVAVIGPSGCGKSSLLHAGLLAAAAAAGMRTSTAALADLPMTSLATGGVTLVVVDQFEQVLTDQYDDSARGSVLEAAARLAATPSVVLALGLRADFLGRALAEPALAPLVQRRQLLVAPLGTDELRRVILEPAQRVGRRIQPEVVDLALQDLAGAGPGATALPLLSHALLMSWEAAKEDDVTAAAYVAAGGVKGAVQASAEAAYASLGPEGREATRRLFRRLVLVDGDGTAVQRPVRYEDLEDEPALAAAARAFVDHRILTALSDRFALSHESVSVAWPRLRDWLSEDRESRTIHHRVAQSARAWQDQDEDPGSLLRGTLLTVVRERGAAFRADLSSTENRFVEASVHAAEQAEARERRGRARLRGLLAGLVAVALLASVLAGYLAHAVGEARDARDDAHHTRTEALSRQVANEAVLLRDTEPSVAAQLAVAAYRISPTVEARSALLESTARRLVTRILGPEGSTRSIPSPDGTTLAVTNAEGEVRLHPAAVSGDPATTAVVATDGGELYASAYNADGSLLAVAGAGGLVTVLRLIDGEPEVLATAETPDRAGVVSLAFDGDVLLAGTGVPSVERWRVSDDRLTLLPSATGFGGQVNGLAIAPDGTLATASADGAVRLWRQRGDRLRLTRTLTIGDPSVVVTSVAYSPDGRWLAAGGRDRAVRVWAVEQGHRLARTLGDFPNWVNGVAFSPDGTQLAGGASGAVLRTWRTGTWASLLDLSVGGGNITSVAWAQDGAHVVLASIDGMTRLVPTAGPRPAPFGDTVWNLGIPEGATTAYLGTGSQEPAVRAVDVTDPLAPVVDQASYTAPPEAGDLTGSSAVSPDGRTLVGGTDSGKVAVWRVDGRRDGPTVVDAASALIEATVFTPDSSAFVAISDDGTVTLFANDRPVPRQLRRITVEGLALSISISPDGSLAAVGTSSNRVHLIRLADGAKLGDVATDNYVYGVAFSPDGARLAATGADRSVRVWDVSAPASPRAVAHLTGPVGATFGVAWDPTGSRLAAASQEGGSVWVWERDGEDFTTFAEVAPLEAGAISLGWLEGGEALLVGGIDGEVSSWLVDPETAARTVCDRSGSRITEAEWERHVPGLDYRDPCGS